MIKNAGFSDVELVAETNFNSSPVTKGVLFRAMKPIALNIGKTSPARRDLLGNYQVFFDAVYSDGAIDRKTKHLIALAASLGAGCDP